MKLTNFLKAATKRERAAVAVACSGSVCYLSQIAGGHRFASPQLATEIEEKTRQIAAVSHGRLEGVPWQSLVRHLEILRGVCSREDNQYGNTGAAEVQSPTKSKSRFWEGPDATVHHPVPNTNCPTRQAPEGPVDLL